MERIPGGKARGGRCPRNVDKAELAQGIKVELEHTTDRRVAREIACDHLTEDGRYYSKLATIHLDGGQRPRARVLRGPAAPTFTVYVRNELIGTSRYVGTFASQAEAQAYVEAEARQARKFTTFEVWTGTPRAPRKPVAGATARGLHGASVGGRRRQVAAPAVPALPTLSEAEHAEWTAMQAVTAALRSRDPAKIAQAKAALAAANEATFQAWGRLPAAERLRRREAGDVPPGV